MPEYKSKIDNKTYEVNYGTDADPSTYQINILVDPKDKIEVEAIMKRLGYNPYLVVSSLFKYILKHERLPRELSVEEFYKGIESGSQKTPVRRTPPASYTSPYISAAVQQTPKKKPSWSLIEIIEMFFGAILIGSLVYVLFVR